MRLRFVEVVTCDLKFVSYIKDSHVDLIIEI